MHGIGKKRGSGIVVALALVALAASCGSPRDQEESSSQNAALDDPDGSDATSEAASDAAACRNVTLDASRSYKPSVWTDAEQNFSPNLRFKLPQVVTVTAGNSGNHWLTIQYSIGTSDAGPDAGGPVTCRYDGGASKSHPTTPADIALGLQYAFRSCDNGAQVGTVVEADHVTLHIQNGDNQAGPTSVTVTLAEEQPCGPPSCNPQTCDDHDACNGVESWRWWWRWR